MTDILLGGKLVKPYRWIKQGKYILAPPITAHHPSDKIAEFKDLKFWIGMANVIINLYFTVQYIFYYIKLKCIMHTLRLKIIVEHKIDNKH